MLTNPGMGSLGSSSRAGSPNRPRSRPPGHRHAADGLPATAGADATTRLVLADPVAVATQVGHPIGDHSGLGLSAFYYTLLLVLAGFLGGNVISNGVDTALGYADNEIGPGTPAVPPCPSAAPRRCC